MLLTFVNPYPAFSRCVGLIACMAVLLIVPIVSGSPMKQTHDLMMRRITITAEPTTLGMADTLTLTVEDQPLPVADGQAGAGPMQLDWQALRTSLEAALPDALVLVEAPGAGPAASRRTFNIEPLTPGTFTIPAFQISVTMDTSVLPAGVPALSVTEMIDALTQQGLTAEAASLADQLIATTQPIEVTVTSAFAEGEQPAVGELRSIADPVWPIPWVMIAVIAGSVAVVAIAAWLLIAGVNHQRNTRIVTITADALAHRTMDAVLSGTEPSAAGHKLLLERASAVLRGYLEDRFGLHAPELTTAEFLRDAEANALADNALSSHDRRVLGEFLSRVDMVKYAGAQATREDAERAVASVRSFIDRTADPSVTLVVQRGRRIIENPGAAARLLRDLDHATHALAAHAIAAASGGR